MRISPKLVSIVKILGAVCISVTLVFPAMVNSAVSFDGISISNLTCVSKVYREIEIPPGSDYYIKFDAQNLTLTPQTTEPVTTGLSENVILAIAKSPRWIQHRLTSQFHTLSDPESFAQVLLNSSKQYADEIAFSIACCPMGRVPPAPLLKENAEAIYQHDRWIHYADIIDFDDGSGDYYSTIRYALLDDGTADHMLLPSSVYYWYVVHPKITNEEIDAVYGPLWRNYLFEHNDLGYPLLKEKMSTIQYLWDREAYFQPDARLWSECIQQHPTAVEAVSYWIGKTVPAPAVGDRPGWASVIAHQHNGWCGELQKIAVAAQRAVLVPSIAACNVGEDHVWREFYEQGWHENDNWWSDTGGAVDKPDVYAYDWGKNMSAIYQWRGDGTILHDTVRYIHAEDRITVDFVVKDLFLQPVDGTRVIVLVKGPKDITYYKNLIWEKIQDIWNRLPEFLKGKLLSALFSRLEERLHQLPDIINGVTIATWNYTDSNGQCSFELGKNLDYLFLIQQGNLKKPWQLARHNTLRSLKKGVDTTFKMVLFDLSHKPQHMTKDVLPVGDCRFRVRMSCEGYQLEKHFFYDGIGRHESSAGVECFFVDSENFQRYKQGEAFLCYNYLTGQEMNCTVTTRSQDWYFVLRNYGRHTHAIVDFSFDASVQTTADCVQIVTPDTVVFEMPFCNVGDTILISGVATTDLVTLHLDQDPSVIECPVVDGEWSYAWNTSGASLGVHSLIACVAEDISDERTVLLIDAHPPALSIESPLEGAILQSGIVDIFGQSSDNQGVDHIEITLNNLTKIAHGTTTWNLSWDVSGFPLGDYTVVVKVIDAQGLVTTRRCSFVLNESGHSWGPQIIDFYHEPGNLTNRSNVIIYANVTTTGPFAVDTILLFCENGTATTSYEMYRYGDFPVQSRHPEDPLFDQPNSPLFGKELGQFSTGQMITYWIVAFDSARNTQKSDVSLFTIQ